MPRFLLIITEENHAERWANADETTRRDAFDAYNGFLDAVKEQGQIVAGQALLPPDHARTVVGGSTQEPTPGPFSATVDQICGFYLIEVLDLEVACRLAARLPLGYRIEVRPCDAVQVH